MSLVEWEKLTFGVLFDCSWYVYIYYFVSDSFTEVSTLYVDYCYSPVVSTLYVDYCYSPVVSTLYVDYCHSPVVSTLYVDYCHSPVVSTLYVDYCYSPVVSTLYVDYCYSPVVSTLHVDYCHSPVVYHRTFKWVLVNQIIFVYWIRFSHTPIYKWLNLTCVSIQATISPLGILFLCLDIFSLYQCQDREWSCISLLGDIDFDFVSTFSVGFFKWWHNVYCLGVSCYCITKAYY
jgi:hypothetical protein